MVELGGDITARGYDWWRKIGSPKYVCAPMVRNSELAFRMLVREHSASLCYTPMIRCSDLLQTPEDKRLDHVEPHPADRPLIVQFASDSPEQFVACGRLVQGHCDAVDLNLGCPQEAAVRDHYGACLMEEPELVRRIVAEAARELSVPVTVKMRVFDQDDERTVAFARMLEEAGASMVAVHGRTKVQTHHQGECRWDAIGKVKKALSIPVLANGGPIRTMGDVESCLEATGCDGVMCAIGLLLNPRLFAGNFDTGKETRLAMLLEYLEHAARHKSTPARAMRDHMQVMLRDMICPTFFRRHCGCDDHKDLWNMVCSSRALWTAWQCSQVALTLAWRLDHPLKPERHPPRLKAIKLAKHDVPTWDDDEGCLQHEGSGSDGEPWCVDLFS